jgi:hypothetical protein
MIADQNIMKKAMAKVDVKGFIEEDLETYVRDSAKSMLAAGKHMGSGGLAKLGNSNFRFIQE